MRIASHILTYPLGVSSRKRARDLDEDDYFNDQFTIKKVKPGKVVFEGLLEGEEDIVISLPKSVTSKAKAGSSMTIQMARIKGKWGILGVGNVYP